MDAKSEEEDSSGTSPDTEGGTKKGEKERVVMKNVKARVALPYWEHLLPSRRVKQPFMGPKWWKGRPVTKKTGVASRTVTYDMGKMLAALTESAQALQSDEGAKSSPCQKKKKKDKGSPRKQRSPLSSKKRAKRAKKHKDKKRKKSNSTSSSQSSKGSSGSN